MNAEEYYNLGQEKFNLKQYAEAIEDYNKAIELDKDFEKAFYQRAFCKGMLKDNEGALADYKVAISINPNDPMTYLNAGGVAYFLDNNTKDTSYFDKAIELGAEKVPQAYYLRGIIYGRMGEYKKAIEDYNKAIELLDYDEIHYLRGESYLELGEYNKAIEDYNKYLETTSVSEDLYGVCSAYYGIGYIKYIQGNHEQALSYYKKVKELDPNFHSIDNDIEMCEDELKVTQ